MRKLASQLRLLVPRVEHNPLRYDGVSARKASLTASAAIVAIVFTCATQILRSNNNIAVRRLAAARIHAPYLPLNQLVRILSP